MRAKRLPKASLAAGFPVGTVDGMLCLIEPTRSKCRGYRTCCICDECRARESKAHGTVHRVYCSCTTPLIADETCFRCGHNLERAA